MSTHKHIDIICLVAAFLALVLCAVFMNGEALGIQSADKVMGYENRLFDTSKVHTIDIVIDDWDEFLSTAQSEEYSVCSVVIDGEAITNVGIRGKGNTSLSTVASMDSDRYSFKIEFDQYDSTKTYHGLDKLSLNNIIQDNTYMKDYLSYRMMDEFDVPTPLCSYTWITVNGEDWGLYLAVEAVEESFLQRNYGSNYGELYKPDSMDMGRGRGNGRDFEMPDFTDRQENADENSGTTVPGNTKGGLGNRGGMMPGESANEDETAVPGNMKNSFGQGGFSLDEETVRKAFEDLELDTSVLDGIDFENITVNMIQSMLVDLDRETMQKLMQKIMGSSEMQISKMGSGFGGKGSAQTKLQYIDDDTDSYSTIFGSAKTDITEADQTRLITALKQLSAYENLEEVVNIEDVLRYFVVHNYVVNGDSYTGSMVHNYYLYEEDSQLSMIPWDYNLAFGTFRSNNASSAVNDDIDDVLSDRPMQAWIFSDETYSQRYYELYAELLEQVDIQGIIDNAYELIAPYVEKDTTAFCTYDEFQTGVETLKDFCALRSESVQLQLSGSTETVDVGTLNLSAMGTMGGGMGGFGGRGDFGSRGNSITEKIFGDERTARFGGIWMPDRMQTPDGMTMPDGMQRPNETMTPGNTYSPAQDETTDSSQNNDSSTEGSSQANASDGMSSFGYFSLLGDIPDFGSMDNFNGMVSNGQDTETTITNILLLSISILFLTVGLIVAFKFNR